MSVTLYDKALLNKINNWTEKTDIHIYGPSEAKRAVEVISDMKKDDNIKLPLLILSRPDGYQINNLSKTPQTFDGKKFIREDYGGSVTLLNAIPITIPYTLDVFTRYEEEADAYMRELLFNFINYPRIKITLPYEGHRIQHISNVRITSQNVGTNVNDWSIHSDQIFNYRIELDIDDAYLWDVRTKSTVYINPYDLSVSVHNIEADVDVVDIIEPVVTD